MFISAIYLHVALPALHQGLLGNDCRIVRVVSSFYGVNPRLLPFCVLLCNLYQTVEVDLIYFLNQDIRGQYKVIVRLNVCLLFREEDKNQS